VIAIGVVENWKGAAKLLYMKKAGLKTEKAWFKNTPLCRVIHPWKLMIFQHEIGSNMIVIA
jgi:hypothetical protein